MIECCKCLSESLSLFISDIVLSQSLLVDHQCVCLVDLGEQNLTREKKNNQL